MFTETPQGQTNYDVVAEIKARIELLATEFPVRESDEFDEGRLSMKRECLDIINQFIK